MTSPTSSSGSGSWVSRVLPWLLPALIVVEIVLVVSGRLGVGTALVIVLGLELLLGLVVLGRSITAVRQYRAGRADGIDGWAAAQDALAQLVPRRLARLILLEVRLLVCLARWATGRHEGRAPGSFGYRRGIGALLWIVFGLGLVEGAVVEIVLVAAVPHTPWPWIALGLHLYALVWLAGLQACLATRPHRLTERKLLVRDGIGAELIIPYPAILGARVELRENAGRSGFVNCGGDALLAIGDATVALTLDPEVPILVAGAPNRGPMTGLTSLAITADEPRELVRALHAAQAGDAVRQPVHPG